MAMQWINTEDIKNTVNKTGLVWIAESEKRVTYIRQMRRIKSNFYAFAGVINDSNLLACFLCQFINGQWILVCPIGEKEFDGKSDLNTPIKEWFGICCTYASEHLLKEVRK